MMHELAPWRKRRIHGFTWLQAATTIPMLLAFPAAAQTASGHFSSRALDVPIAGAYSYWDQASGGKDRVVKVVVSNAEFRTDLLDDWHDRAAALREFFVSDSVKIVTVDFDADGKYRGYSYYVRGDRAVILFDGSSKLFDALHGEVILRRAGNTWLVADELVQIGKRTRRPFSPVSSAGQVH